MDRTRKKILVVEDDSDAASVMGDFLQLEGQWVSIAPDGEEGLKQFEEFKPDIILLDLKLPTLDGYSFCQKIREKSDCPIFVVSGQIDSTEDMRKIFALKVNDIFEKPVNLDSLLSKIRLYLEMQETKRLCNELEEEVGRRHRAEKSLEELNERLKNFSTRDTLTNLFNKRYFQKRLLSEFERAKRYFFSLSIVRINLDDFESLNELYGKSYGDVILQEFSSFLESSIRACDIPTRYGGEEFVVLLPNTTLAGAYIFSQNLLECMDQHTFDNSGKKIKLKASLGVTGYPDNGAISPEMLLGQSAKALETSKSNGGNQCQVFFVGTEGNIADLLNADNRKDIEEIKGKIAQLAVQVNRAIIDAICAFARTVKSKDQYSADCIDEIVRLVILIGQELNLANENIESLKQAALLYDIGKIGIDSHVLRKKGKLTSNETEMIRKHPIFSAEILRPIYFLKDVISTVLYHHERYDGQGYPAGLLGEQIPFDARVMAVVDVFEALKCDRPYRSAYSKDEAVNIIKKGAGTQFDPKIVDAFVNVANRL